jgi:hypothetical protein
MMGSLLHGIREIIFREGQWRRQIMKFRVKGISYWTIIFCCLLFAAACASLPPEQIHLTVQGDSSTSVTVSWVTKGKDDTDTHTVKYRTGPGDYTGVADGSSHPIPNEPFGYVHEVELTGLEPNTTYYYICGDELGGWSSEYTLTLAPGSTRDFTFVVVGDMGTTPAARQNLDWMISEDPSFVLHTGDLSYANGFTAIWDIWFNQISPLSANALYMPSIGNHEDEPDLGISSYLGRFALPSNERWYSFDWGNTHVVSLDTESSYIKGSDQSVWLEKDLAQASADPDIEWIVVFFHKPPYSASSAHGSNLAVRQNISPILESNGVDIVFNGHDHTYERSYPMENEKVVDDHPNTYDNPQGTIYVVTGGGGAPLYEGGSDYWTAYAESVHHHVKVDILAEGSLHLQAISKDGRVLDECWVYK